MWSYLGQVAGGLAVAGVTAYLSARFGARTAAKRFVEEKRWEKKYDLYATIYESLNTTKDWLSALRADLTSGTRTEDQIGDWHLEFREVVVGLLNAQTISPLLLSAQAVEALTAFLSRFGKDIDKTASEKPDSPLENLLGTLIQHVHKFAVEFPKIAREDLGIA